MRGLAVAALMGLAPMGLGCGGAMARERPLGKVAIPVHDRGTGDDDGEVRENPPPPDPARELAMPVVVRDSLANGLSLCVAERSNTPFVELRLVLPAAGLAAEGERTGLAAIVAQWAMESGAARASGHEIRERAAALGGALEARTTLDATIFSLRTPAARLDDALGLLARVARGARLDEASFAWARAVTRAGHVHMAYSNGAWAESMLLYRELFAMPASLHPYASFDVTPAEIDKLKPADARAFYKRAYVPEGASLVAAGSVRAADLRASVERAFGTWKGAPVSPANATDPTPPARPRIYVVDAPRAPRASLSLGVLVMASPSDAWSRVARVTLAGQGGFARAALDRRSVEADALAVELTPLAHGPSPLVLHASVLPARAGLAAAALFEAFSMLGEAVLSADALAAAKRTVVSDRAHATETPAGLADVVASDEARDVAKDADEVARASLAALDVGAFRDEARSAFRVGTVLVVRGDATVIAPRLASLGEVTVVAPEREFARVRTVLADPKAPLELAPTPRALVLTFASLSMPSLRARDSEESSVRPPLKNGLQKPRKHRPHLQLVAQTTSGQSAEKKSPRVSRGRLGPLAFPPCARRAPT